MRELLFRGKRIDNGEWVYGVAFPHDNCGKVTMFRQNQGDGALEGLEVLPETVGQYTGLTDKNGTKVFEGDIVKQRGFLNNYYSSVWYAAGRFLVRDYETLLPTALGGISRYEIEVIDNIHDNPELLEGKS